MNLLEKENVAIRIPKNFNETFYNYSIIFPGFFPSFGGYSNLFYIVISYDKLELITKFEKNLEDISPVVPLFQVIHINILRTIH